MRDALSWSDFLLSNVVPLQSKISLLCVTMIPPSLNAILSNMVAHEMLRQDLHQLENTNNLKNEG